MRRALLVLLTLLVLAAVAREAAHVLADVYAPVISALSPVSED